MAGHEPLTPRLARRLPSDAGSGAIPAGRKADGPASALHRPHSPDLGIYVYCIVETKEDLDLGPIGIGDGDNRVYTVRFGNLAAVASDTPLRLYEPSRENVLAHEMVTETVMKDHTVIPMSFSTIFRTEEDIVELLRTTGRAFSDVLGRIRDKIELGLKVVWDRERVAERIEAENEEIRELKKAITEATTGSTYFARMRLGRLVEAALETRAASYVASVYERLQPLAAASRSNSLIGDSMILNAAFLVDRGKENDFDAAVEGLTEQHHGVLSFKYTGPWPPYNFVNIKLKLERAD